MTKRLISFLIALCIFIAIPLSARYKYNPFTRKLDYYETGADIDLGDLADVTLTGLATGNVLYYDGSAWVNLATGANTQFLTLAAGIPAWQAIPAGVVTFVGLNDTPANYTGANSYMVRVNAGGNALVFGAESAIDHDGLTNYLAAQHLTLPATIATVLTDHNLLAHTALGLFDASADVDHDATTNWVANKHIDWTAATDELDITRATAPLIDLNPAFQGSGHVVDITPTAILNTVDADWDGVYVNGAALDPSVAGVYIHGMQIDLTGVDITNEPRIDGLHIEVPATYHSERAHAIHANHGIYLEADVTTLVAGMITTTVDVAYSTAGATGGMVHALDVARAGGGTIGIAAVGTHTAVDVIHQHIGTITSFDKVWEYDNDGPGWTDITAACGNPAVDVAIWDDVDDEVYFGQAAVFDEIVCVWNTVATKNMFLDFYYSVGGAAWTQFYPADDTDGAQGDGAIRFMASDLAGWVVDTVNGTANKYWVKVERTRVSGVGPTEDTIRFITGISYEWDKDGEITIKDITITTPVNIYALSHNSWADYAANQHVVLPNTIANVLSDHNLAAHTVLGLFDASADVDHDATTNWVANKHINWTAAADNFSTTEDFHLSWGDAVDHAAFVQSSGVGIEDQPLVKIQDDRAGATVDEPGEASLYIKGDTPAGFSLYVRDGQSQFDGDTTQTEDIFWTWAAAADHAVITQTSGTGIEDQALIYIEDARSGSETDEPDEATVVINNTGGIWALYIKGNRYFQADGTSYFEGDTYQKEDIFWSWTEAADNAVIAQTAVAGTENVPLIFINDDRTGATVDEIGEATIVIDAEGSYAMSIIDGAVDISGASKLEMDATLQMKDERYIVWGSGNDWYQWWDLNGAGDDIWVWQINSAATSAIFVSKLNPTAMTDHDNYLSPTFVLANDEAADANDYAGVVIGERAQASVLVAHYFDFYAMTGAADGSVDPANAEIAATFRFGDSGSTVPTYATGPGDVLFEDDVEIDGNTWFDANAMLVDNILFNIGTDSDGSFEYDETTNDAIIFGLPSTNQRGIILCDKADIAADFSAIVFTSNFPHFNMVDSDVDSSLSLGFFGDDMPTIVSFSHPLNINYNADQDVKFFVGAESGENPEVFTYGWDAGIPGAKYAKRYIDTAGKLNFWAQETPIIYNQELRVPCGVNNVSNPPTDAELDAIFGTPATVGAGFFTYINDAGAGNDFYHVVSDGTNWWIFTGTKATI